ncbi:hypothetical protein QR680_000678 [Steinernema hermaphroditum]|uniref:Uncharacterized protein n=1 Tax=Steinernema hermaphroditum TaxID=289476 RepID=A0AA39GXF9_9BILA|nr:hypothetical protein QR680_000678 [Steinernema hermaphroditum]
MLETLFRSRCVIQHLYGPFWISVALIVTTGILGNLSKYIKSSGAADQTLLSFRFFWLFTGTDLDERLQPARRVWNNYGSILFLRTILVVGFKGNYFDDVHLPSNGVAPQPEIPAPSHTIRWTASCIGKI